ncbi:MAG: PH domain-containing protein [Planctomycetaceae bacterium]
MQNEPADIITAELGARERLIWAGRPRLGLMLRPADAFLIPFSLLWGGFAISFGIMALVDGAPVFVVLCIIPFVLVGLYVIFGRFVVDAKRRQRTFYGVTNERIIIVSGLFSRSIKSLNLDTLSDLSLTERAGGAGTITFGPIPPWYAWSGPAWPGMGLAEVPSFELAGEAKHVYDVIRSAQRDSRPHAVGV